MIKTKKELIKKINNSLAMLEIADVFVNQFYKYDLVSPIKENKHSYVKRYLLKNTATLVLRFSKKPLKCVAVQFVYT